ncbi:XRE family transcriptional regulator [Niveispirillum cyanobacteriorum]|uniref:XRE family transcriptional regulator n=2 Tax=Niveispirillum cyanobacteriorum TaxID=1612173 RepID=A0A2K9NBX5_9PROT|nr:XRE family transcriptional regulator [Niveispirillum cyanobacteriorum]GGE52588.1 transcriptional regulator [Niveispirillum cyanobacteriorum]
MNTPMKLPVPPFEDPAADQRHLLGAFLRDRRGRLDPVVLGLAVTGRRRTAGLRREEVAADAGISATWLTWLEQGRDIQASPQALDRLARTLRLTGAERAYLFQLSGRRDPRQPDPGQDDGGACARLRDAVAAITVPAYALDHRLDLLAWNGAAADLFAGWLDEPGPHNLLRYLFLDPAAKKLLVDWPGRAARVLAEFRVDHGRHLADTGLTALIAELRAGSAEFAARWAGADIRGREGGERLFQHPVHGLRRYRQMTLSVETRPDLRLVMLLPD